MIRELDTNPDLSRNGITNRAIVIAHEQTKDMTDVEKEYFWVNVSQKLPELDNLEIDVSVSTAMQVILQYEQLYDNINKTVMRAFNLKKLQGQYIIQLLWMSYYTYLLRDKAIKVGHDSEQEDITGPEMVKRLVHIILLNREKDKGIIQDIKSALLRWKE